MSPGPKRKGKKDSSRGKVKHSDACNGQNNSVPNEASGETEVPNEASGETEVTDFSEGSAANEKYRKRQIQSNWERYVEQPPPCYEDTLRGKRFEDLVSHQGGSQSYLKLKEEKEWSDDVDLKRGLYLDLEKLELAFRSVPFHESLGIPEHYFTPDMIQRFKDVAANASNQFMELYAPPAAASLVKTDTSVLCPASGYKLSEENEAAGNNPLKLGSSQACVKDDTSLLCPTSALEVSDTTRKPKEITKMIDVLIECLSRKDESQKVAPAAVAAPASLQTEDIIVSLTKCLSLKDESQKVAPAAVAAPASLQTEDIIVSLTKCLSLKDESQKVAPAAVASPTSLLSNTKAQGDQPKSATQNDDLASLLSLSGFNRQADVIEQESSSAGIDDWLNELLNK